jgi:hypothetical protein
MRKLPVALAVSLFAVLAVPGMALATHSNGQGPAQDFISGAAKAPIAVPCPLGVAPGHFHANAQALDNVTNVARGQFWTDIDFTTQPGGNCIGFTSASFSGEVVCLNAYNGPPPDINSANWAGRIDEVVLQPGDVPGIPGLLFAGMGVLSRHVDNGEPGRGRDRALGFTTPTPVGCAATILGAPFQTLQITQGNLVVHRGA